MIRIVTDQVTLKVKLNNKKLEVYKVAEWNPLFNQPVLTGNYSVSYKFYL